MSFSRGEAGKPISWPTAAQGDILTVASLMYPSTVAGESESIATPDGVVLISQTCDLVQDRERVLVAPLIAVAPSELVNIKKGRKPLLLAVGSRLEKVANLEMLLSIPREALSGALVAEQTFEERTGTRVAELSSRIARAVARFAFPDEVHDALKRLHRKIVDGYSKSTHFASVLELIDEFRVACDAWDSPQRNMSIYAVIPARYLPAADLRPLGWEWTPTTVTGLKNNAERPNDLSLERISELLLANLQSENDSAVVELWDRWARLLHGNALPAPSNEVASVILEAVSGSDFTYDQYVNSGALDFSVLSMTESVPSASSPPAVADPR